MVAASSSKLSSVAALRAEVRALEVGGRARELGGLPFGLDPIDRRLAGGGLVVAALHEVAGTGAGLGDEAAAALFAAGIAARRAGTVLWALGRRDLFAPGLQQAGLCPSRVLYAECRNDEEVLAVMEEGLRHGGLGAVVGEVARAPMAATRRLQLAAEEGGVTALMLKRWRRRGEDPFASPSAAVTRWRIACVPSADLPAEGIGRHRWRVALARQRGGEAFELTVEGSDAEGRLALPALSADRPLAADRADGGRRAA